jgi:hypothetical protein
MPVMGDLSPTHWYGSSYGGSVPHTLVWLQLWGIGPPHTSIRANPETNAEKN